MGTVNAASPEIFRRRTAIGLAILCAVSLLSALILSAVAGDLEGTPSPATSAHSRSAIGYLGLIGLPRRVETKVGRQPIPVLAIQRHARMTPEMPPYLS